MPAGHTEGATINDRRPLTDTMRGVLRSAMLAQRHALGMWPREMSPAERNAARALRHRGLLAMDEVGAYSLTADGRAAIVTKS